MERQPTLFESPPILSRFEDKERVTEETIRALLLEANNAEPENGAYYYIVQCTETCYVLRVQRFWAFSELRQDEGVAFGPLAVIHKATQTLATIGGRYD